MLSSSEYGFDFRRVSRTSWCGYHGIHVHDKVEDEYYIDTQLNEMMQKYKENNVDRDIFYEEERDKIKAAREEVIRKKKEWKKKKH